MSLRVVTPSMKFLSDFPPAISRRRKIINWMLPMPLGRTFSAASAPQKWRCSYKWLGTRRISNQDSEHGPWPYALTTNICAWMRRHRQSNSTSGLHQRFAQGTGSYLDCKHKSYYLSYDEIATFATQVLLERESILIRDFAHVAFQVAVGGMHGGHVSGDRRPPMRPESASQASIVIFAFGRVELFGDVRIRILEAYRLLSLWRNSAACKAKMVECNSQFYFLFKSKSWWSCHGTFPGQCFKCLSYPNRFLYVFPQVWQCRSSLECLVFKCLLTFHLSRRVNSQSHNKHP